MRPGLWGRWSRAELSQAGLGLPMQGVVSESSCVVFSATPPNALPLAMHRPGLTCCRFHSTYLGSRALVGKLLDIGELAPAAAASCSCGQRCFCRDIAMLFFNYCTSVLHCYHLGHLIFQTSLPATLPPPLLQASCATSTMRA